MLEVGIYLQLPDLEEHYLPLVCASSVEIARPCLDL